MELVNLGRTGIKVSRICLGCMTYGSSRWRPWVLDEEASRPFFRRAIEAGVNFFDTADVYSLGGSEEGTGGALREYGRMGQLGLAPEGVKPLGGGAEPKGVFRTHILHGGA